MPTTVSKTVTPSNIGREPSASYHCIVGRRFRYDLKVSAILDRGIGGFYPTTLLSSTPKIKKSKPYANTTETP